MNNIAQILKADNWQDLLRQKFPGCDPSMWSKARKSLLSGQSKRRRTGRSQRRSKDSQVAAQNRALAALVERVNEPQKMTLPQQAEMAAMWEASHPDDDYGLVPREIGDLRW